MKIIFIDTVTPEEYFKLEEIITNKISAICPDPEEDIFILYHDNWDDYGFSILYKVYHYFAGSVTGIGRTKIANLKDMESPKFEPYIYSGEIGYNFYSIGQEEEFYKNLYRLHEDIAKDFLCNIRDLANIYKTDSGKYNQFLEQIDERDKLPAKLSYGNKYNIYEHALFRETSPMLIKKFADSISRDFENKSYYIKFPENFPLGELNVDLNRKPRTQVHVLIGTNGIGKTKLLHDIVNKWQSQDIITPETFALHKLMYVSMSMFDNSENVNYSNNNYMYVGLSRFTYDAEALFGYGATWGDEYLKIIKNIKGSNRLSSMYIRMIKILKSIHIPPVIQDSLSNIQGYFEDNLEDEAKIRKIYKEGLSSGYRVMLSILAAIVINFRDIRHNFLLIDEMEVYLHPPLVANFYKAIEYLMSETNSVAIISTHSPIIAREVPRGCVHMVSVNDQNCLKVRNPEFNTYGASIDYLTREIFDLEYYDSGFYKELVNESKKYCIEHPIQPEEDIDLYIKNAFKEINNVYSNQLGTEAKSMLSVIIRAVLRKYHDVI